MPSSFFWKSSPRALTLAAVLWMGCGGFSCVLAQSSALSSQTRAKDHLLEGVPPLSLSDLETLPAEDGGGLSLKNTAHIPLSSSKTLQKHYERRIGETLSFFGYDLFENAKPLSDKIPAGMVADTYQLGVGDKVDVIFRGQENLQKTYTVDTRDFLVVDTLSPIQVAGKSLGDIRSTLEADAAALHNLDIFVSLSEPRQIDVLVVGHIKNPGRKTLNAFHTVFDALQESGGITEGGSLRSVRLVRAGKSRFIDLYDILMGTETSADIPLMDGDRLIVPPIGPTIALSGSIKRPAIYELKKGDRLTLLETLGLCGGTLVPGNHRTTRLSLTETGEEKIEDITDPQARIFSNGDILSVTQTDEEKIQNVTLSGHSRDSGIHDIRKAQTLSRLINLDTRPKENIYPLLGVIERRDPQELTRTLLEFSPRLVLGGTSDLSLNEGDRVYLFSKEDIKAFLTHAPRSQNEEEDGKTSLELPEISTFVRERLTFIRGAIRFPGGYPIADGTSLASLVATAGGPTLEANKDLVEITHHLRPPSSSVSTSDNNRGSFSLDNGSDITLSPGDTVRISQKFNRVEEQSVVLSGEVKNPGRYDLSAGDTLHSLIERAGGLTETAYPDGVIFSRASERKREESRYKTQADDLEMKLAATLEDSQANKEKKPDMAEVDAARGLIAQLREAQAVGRITVEADPGVLAADPEQDILLEPGDKIYIPRRPLNVRVGGEVLSPAALQFRKGKNAQDYIEEAGGTTYYADRSRAFVVYPDGSAKPLSVSAWKQSITMIPPGSTIIVPRDPKPYDFLENAEKISTILANIALTGFYIDDLDNDN